MSESPYIFEATRDNFASLVLEGSRKAPVLVDFWAGWCQPCKILLPILTKLVGEFGGKFILAKVNTEEQQELAIQFGVRSIPSVKLFKDGELVDEFMGALPEPDLRAFLERHIPRESDKLLASAAELLGRGEVEKARPLIESAYSSDPENARTVVAFARLQAILGNFEAAESALDRLPISEQASDDVQSLRSRMEFDRIAQSAPEASALEERLAADPQDSDALFQLAAYRAGEGDYAAALELLFRLMQKDRAYQDDAARKAMLRIFDMLGGSGDLVSRYRSRMFNLLH